MRHWSTSPQQAARRPLPPDLLPRNRRCCARIRDFPGALCRRHQVRAPTDALLCAPSMPPAALAPPAPSRPRAALRRRGRRYGRRPALSVACRSLAQMLRLVAEDVAASWSAPWQSCHVPQPGKLPARASWWVLVQVLGGFAAGDLVCTAARTVACWPCSGRVECGSVLSVCWCGGETLVGQVCCVTHQGATCVCSLMKAAQCSVYAAAAQPQSHCARNRRPLFSSPPQS